jgi:hypothetical protein
MKNCTSRTVTEVYSTMESEELCVCERERERVRVCVCVCVSEGERERARRIHSDSGGRQSSRITEMSLKKLYF